MSIRLMTDVWRTTLPTVEKMILLVIADHANDDGGEAWPSQATIAKKASVSIRTVQRSVNSLVIQGYLRMEKHRGGSATCREDRRPHRYTIQLHKLRGDKETTRIKRGDFGDLDGATLATDTGRLSRPKNLPLETPLETPTEFDLFWSIYPIKVGKKKAKDAFNKAMTETDFATLIAGATRYAEDPNRVEAYTAHPTTWLNAGRWADDPLPERELSKEEKTARELLESQRRAEIEKAKAAEYMREQEEAKRRAVPMPEELRKLLRRSP